LKDDGPLVGAQAATKEELLQAQAELLAMTIPPVDRKAPHVDAIASYELHGV
jgi:hypothetical protein